MLFSNNRLLPANIEIDNGFRDEIATLSQRNVQLFSEFLDQPTFSGSEYEQTVTEYLRKKYAVHPPGIIIAVGDNALEFMLRHHGDLFQSIPVLHIAVGSAFLRANEPVPSDVVGIPADYDSLGTIQLALRWHPRTQRLVIVTGASDWDRGREAALRTGIPALNLAVTVEFLAALPSDAVVNRLAELGPGDVVYTPGYFRDGAGREFLPRDSAALMAAKSRAPIYAPYNPFIGTGIVGGRMPDFKDMGRQAAIAVNHLLDGVPLVDLKLPAKAAARVNVDWRQVLKWKIDPALIPIDSVVHFRQPSFWEEHRKQALLIAAVILLQALLIAALLVERRLRRRTASALQESEDRMSLAARAARLSMWVWEMVGTARKSSADAQAQTGARAVAPISFDDVLQTVHPSDRERFGRAVRQSAAGDEELEIEYRSVEPDGETRWFAARGRAEKPGGRMTGVAMDITARKTAEQQAERDRSALTHMARVSIMGQLSVSIAHQLNQPLAAILGNAEAAYKMLDHDVLDIAELKEICGDIITQDHRATEVIRHLGALYKRGELKLEPLNLNELVTETLNLVHTELTTRHVTVTTELAPSPLIVDGGRVHLQQVLLNLILNAADAMSEVGADQRHLVIRTELDGESVRLRVIDNGTGIAPQNLKNVFDAFWTSKVGGIGVGLAICKSIIAAHQGTLTAANNGGPGATFCATWPVRLQVSSAVSKHG